MPIGAAVVVQCTAVIQNHYSRPEVAVVVVVVVALTLVPQLRHWQRRNRCVLQCNGVDYECGVDGGNTTARQ